jgi:hypothetical protein
MQPEFDAVDLSHNMIYAILEVIAHLCTDPK